jgi:hypothetical protein
VSGITVGSKSTLPKHFSKFLKIKAAMEEHYSIPVEAHFLSSTVCYSRNANVFECWFRTYIEEMDSGKF